MSTEPGSPESRTAGSARLAVDYRALFDSLSGLCAVVLPDDPHFTVVATNDAWTRAIDQPHEAVVGRSLFEVVPAGPAPARAATLENLRHSFSQVLLTRRPDTMPVQQYDLPSLEFDGGMEERYWSPVNTPVLNAEGGITQIIHRVEDVTERWHVEQALRASERESERLKAEREKQLETFDTVLARLQEFVYLFDLNGRFLYVNKPLLDLWGLTLEQAIGKGFADLGYPDELVRLHGEQIRQVIETRQPIYGGNSYTSPAGVTGRYEYTFVPLLASDGSVEAVGGHTRDVTESTRAREALRTSGTKYRTLFDSIDEGFCIIQLIHDEQQRPVDFRYIEVNQVFAKQTGLRDAAGKTTRELMLDIEPYWIEFYYKVSLTGEPARFINHVKQLERWFEVYAFRIGEAKTHTVAVIFRDITANRIRATNLAFLADVGEDFSRLTSADEIMRTVGAKVGSYLNVTTCNFVDVDEVKDELTVVYAWNDAGVPSLVRTYRTQEIVNEEFQRAGRAGEVFVVRDTQTDPRTDARALAALNVGAFVNVPVHAGGELRHHFAISDKAARDWREDEIELIQELATRMFPRLERARTEKALQDSEERFRAIVAQATAGIAETDLSGRFLLVNDRYCALVGRSREELLSLRMQDITHPEDAPVNIAQIHRLVETGKPFVTEKRYLCPDGSSVWVSNSVSLVGDAAGQPRCIIVVTLDISERVKAEAALRRSNEELQRANRGLEEFAHVASHDLQEPLRMVNGYAQLLIRRMGSGATDEQKEFAGFIQTGVRRMEQLIKDMLSYSRTIHNADEPATTDASLDESLRQALASVGNRVAETGATITHDPLPNVWGDMTQLSYVFQNLLSNAMKYRKTTEPPLIHIAARREEANWVVSIRDNGIGFAPEQAERIFGLFRRLHREEEYPGTGLGLAICKRIVERYGGRIWAESEPGTGSTFSFSLRAVQP